MTEITKRKSTMTDDTLGHEGTEGSPGRRGFIRRATLTGAAGVAVFLTGRAAQADDKHDGYDGHDHDNRDHDGNDKDGDYIKKTFFDIQRHENAHVAALLSVLGKAARPKPTFRDLIQRNYRHFVQVSQALENTGVGAYLGAAPVILNRAYLAAAGSIALIEARHAGWLNSIVDVQITTNVYGVEQSFETPLTPSQVVALASPFIADLNGGPPVDYSATPSAENDTAILNFALALEYLEADFYNLNAGNF